MSKLMKGAVIAAAISMLMLTCLATPAQAATDGSSMVFVAKGTLYDAVGNVVASNVWFSFKAFVYNYQVNLGMNQVGSATLMEMTTYGNSGSISAMSGPVVQYTSWEFSSFSVTAIYCNGASVNTCTVIANTTPIIIDNIHVGSGVTGPSPTFKTRGPNASSQDWVGITGAVVIALLLIGSLLLLDRRRFVQ